MARKRQARYCTSNRTDGEPCGAFAMENQDVCGAHGGKSPQALAAAEQRAIAAKAAKAVVTFGLAVDVTPHQALLEEVARSAGVVRWLEERVRELDPGKIVAGTLTKVTGKQAMGQVEYVEQKTGTHPLLVIYQQERQHLVNVCRVAIAAGVEERRLQLAEQLGGIFADAMAAVLDDLGLNPDQRDKARSAVPRHLRLLSAELDQQDEGA